MKTYQLAVVKQEGSSLFAADIFNAKKTIT